MDERRALMTSAYLGIALIGGLTISATPLLVPALSGVWAALGFTAATGAAVAWGLAFAMRAHRSLDEYQRERARRATYWGTVGGIVASAPVYAFVAMGGLHRISSSIPTGKPLAVAFASGYGLALVSVIVGITISAAFVRRARVSAAA